MNTVVYLICHGRVDFPLNSGGQQIIYGPYAELGLKGWRQMIDLGKNFRAAGRRFDVLYSSPLFSAVQSANVLLKDVGRPPIVVKESLRATKYPSREGGLVSEFMKAGGDLFANPGPGDETLEEVDRRIWGAFQEIIAESKGKTIGAVIHEEESGVLLHRLNNPGQDKPGKGNPIPNGEAYRLVIDPQFRLVEGQKFSLERVNPGKERK